MDTSKEYVRMCEKAVGVQRDFPDENGNYFYSASKGQVFIQGQRYCSDLGMWNEMTGITTVPSTYSERVKIKGDTWLPRQDQLQGMVDNIGGSYYPSLSSLMETTSDKTPLGHYMVKPEYNYCDSMEQLWLAFVMKEKWGKVWTGKEWEEDKI